MKSATATIIYKKVKLIFTKIFWFSKKHFIICCPYLLIQSTCSGTFVGIEITLFAMAFLKKKRYHRITYYLKCFLYAQLRKKNYSDTTNAQWSLKKAKSFAQFTRMNVNAIKFQICYYYIL